MISIGSGVVELAVRQHELVEDDIFALSADDGANLADDNLEIMETYNDGSST